MPIVKQKRLICTNSSCLAKICIKRKCSYHNFVDNYFFCEKCYKNIFPFNDLNNVELENVFNDKFVVKNCSSSILNDTINEFVLDHNDVCINDAIDPDINFFKDLNTNKSLYYSIEELNNLYKVDNTKFSLFHLNCRSIKNKFQNIEILLSEMNLKFDIIALTETWLTENDDISYYNIDGYNTEYINRKNKHGGGIIIFINNQFSINKINELSFSENGYMDALALEVQVNNTKFNVACIYKPPSVNIHEFTNKFSNYVELLSTKDKCYICGDFNIDLLKYESQNGSKNFVEQLFTSGYYPVISKPTRITNSSSTLIDNIWTNDLSNAPDTISGILVDDISDHFPIFYTIKDGKKNSKGNNEFKYVTQEKELNIQKMSEILLTTNWNSILKENDVNEAYNCFLEKFCCIHKTCCPIKKIKQNKRQDKPWMTNGLKNACRKKNLLYSIFIKKLDKDSKKRYKSYKNKLNTILRNTEKQFYKEQLYSNQCDTKRTWNIINNLLKRDKKSVLTEKLFHNGQYIVDTKNISNIFNNYFSNVGENLASQIENVNVDHMHFMKNKANKTLYLSPVSENDIIDVVNKFKNKRSKDSENLNMVLIKKLIHLLVVPLAHIFNQSLNEGIFPDKMKLAKVIPIFKSGSIENVEDYRPISLLSQFSKILEKVFYKKIMSFVNSNNILSNSQYGFREKLNTAYAISELIEHISDAMDNDKVSIALFIDLKKAFDTINHSILFDKLEYYGIRGTSLNWLKSYLMNRYQYVSFKDYNSDKLLIKYGVPQGSILGPLLFLLYINDLCNISDLLNSILFADDTNFVLSHENVEKLFSIMNSELMKLSLWFKANKLSLNINKTNYLLFGLKNNETNKKVSIDDIGINRVYDTKFLGVILDSELSWKKQIKSIENKVSKGIGLLYKMKSKLDPKALRMIYATLILPYLNYCCEIWGNTYNCRLEKLVRFQKKAIRIIEGLNYLDHTTQAFYNGKILKLPDLISLKTCLYVYKANQNLLPYNLQNKYLSLSQIHSYNTRSSSNRNMFKNKVKKDVKYMCTSIKGVTLYNALTNEIKSANTIYSFKSRMKKMYFTKYNSSDNDNIQI